MIDLVSVVSAIGGSGLLIVGRDVWLARKTVKSADAAENRNQAREPLIVESILLGNTTKVAEIFQAGITELEDAKKRAVEELRETRSKLEAKVEELSQEVQRQRKEGENKDKTIHELHAKIGELTQKIEALENKKE